MSEPYKLYAARKLEAGMFILVPPANGRHRSAGAVDGSQHIRITNVHTSGGYGQSWTEIFFEHGQFTVDANLQVRVLVYG